MGLCVPPDCMSVVTSVPQHQMHSMPAPLRCCHKRSVRGPVWQPWYRHGTAMVPPRPPAVQAWHGTLHWPCVHAAVPQTAARRCYREDTPHARVTSLHEHNVLVRPRTG